MKNALIGFSGFVGSTLLKQFKFDSLYRSINIQEIENKEFNLVVCAAAPAQKWRANKEPENDRDKIRLLTKFLRTIKCQTFILISTVDVFKTPINVNESTSIKCNDADPYGYHRWLLEKFTDEYFPNSLIVRLPGLVGPGLRKNIIFDFLNHNNLEMIESRSVFQFYPMVNLWYDIQIALQAKLKLIHLTASPISVSELSLQGFGKKFTQELTGVPVTYNLKTLYGKIYGAEGDYQYSVGETIQAVRSYAQSEKVTL